MVRSIVLFLYIALAGCAPMQNDTVRVNSLRKSFDGYRFIEKEYENLTPLVEFVLIKDRVEYEKIYKQKFGLNWRNISAFTVWNEKIGKCKIYIKDPAWIYEPELIGHEVAHCIWGRWHNGKEGLEDV